MKNYTKKSLCKKFGGVLFCGGFSANYIWWRLQRAKYFSVVFRQTHLVANLAIGGG